MGLDADMMDDAYLRLRRIVNIHLLGVPVSSKYERAIREIKNYLETCKELEIVDMFNIRIICYLDDSGYIRYYARDNTFQLYVNTRFRNVCDVIFVEVGIKPEETEILTKLILRSMGINFQYFHVRTKEDVIFPYLERTLLRRKKEMTRTI